MTMTEHMDSPTDRLTVPSVRRDKDGFTVQVREQLEDGRFRIHYPGKNPLMAVLSAGTIVQCYPWEVGKRG